MTRYQYLLFIIFIIINSTLSNGQHVGPKFERLSTEDGLSVNTITDICQDSLGFIWIGTGNGLNKYDGDEIINYFNIHDDSTSLCNDFVNTVYADKAGNLWVGTVYGLSKYIQEKNLFENYGLEGSVVPKYSGNHIVDITEDLEGNLYAATIRGNIFSYEPLSNTFTKIDFDRTKVWASIKKIKFDKKGRLWMGTTTGFRVFDQDFKLLHINEQLISDQRCEVNGFIFDNEGNTWVGTSPCGVFKVSSNNFENLDLSYLDTELTNRDRNFVNGTLKTSDGQKWFATSRGLAWHDTKNDRSITYVNSSIDPFSLIGTSTGCLFEDNQQNLWVGSLNQGVSIFRKNKGFEHIRRVEGYGSTLSAPLVSAILVEDGRLWVGNDYGFEIFNMETKKKISYHFTDGTERVWCFHKGEGVVWIGSYYGGLMAFDLETKKIKSYTHDPSNSNSLASNDVRWIHEDKEGYLWLVTHGAGITKFDPKTGDCSHFNKEKNNLRHNWPLIAITSHDGTLYAGTTDGLSVLNKKTQEFENFTPDYEDSTSLPGIIVRSIFEDKNGKLWVGTNKGLALYNANSKKFITFTEKHGVKSDDIVGMQDDQEGNLWVTTLRGMFKVKQFNPKLPFNKKDLIQNYGIQDGLQSNEFVINSLAKSDDDRLFFGGTNGITAFYPKDIDEASHISPTYIKELQVFHKTVKIGDESGILSKDISQTKEITLNYDDKVVTLSFVTLDHRKSGQTRKYAYMMDGFEESWNYVDDRKDATYTNLPSGKYIFRVKSSSEDGVWNGELRSLIINILPPWYLTIWAYIIYFFALLTILYTAFRMVRINAVYESKLEVERLKFEQKQTLMQKEGEIDRVKLKFFTNISHEFRTPLTLILGPVQHILQNDKEGTFVKEAAVLKRNTQRLLRLVNQLLDIRKLDSDAMALNVEKTDITEFIHKIFESFQYLAKRNNITYEINSDQESLDGWIDPDIIEKALYNLISNAFKYTLEGGKISVNITAASSYCQITVRDTGIGVDKKELDNIFDRFYRVEENDAINQSGSGVGLSLTKELIELHRGSIDVNSVKGEGSVFVLSFPFSKNTFEEKDITSTIGIDADESSTYISEEIASPLQPIVYNDEDIEAIINDKNDERSIILIIDDNREIRDYLRHHLSSNYRMLEAINGAKGLELAEKVIPDLIISDIMMPVMNGIEFTKEIKEGQHTSHIPVILLTARSSEEYVMEGLQTGADDYVSKPFSMDILGVRIENLIKTRTSLQLKYASNNVIDANEMSESRLDKEFMNKVIAIINENVANSAFGVDELSSEVAMSRAQLYRKIKALTGLSTGELITKIQFQKATALLTSTQMSIAEICYACGYNDAKYFGKVFKKAFNLSPSEYRKENAKV